MTEVNISLNEISGKVEAPDGSGKIGLVAIIGAGTMGRGIAQLVAASGLDVVLIDKDVERISRARRLLEASMERQILSYGMTSSEMRSIFSKMKFSSSIQDLAAADLVIESVEEDIRQKQAAFVKIFEYSKPGTLLATTTSTLSLADLAGENGNSSNLVGLHFVQPVEKVSIVEVIKAFSTTDAAYGAALSFIKKLGREAVEVYENPGFITTRAVLPLLNEAMYILMEGLASAEDIDRAMKAGFEMGMGPLELADSMGLDQVLLSMNGLWKSLGELRFQPCPILRRLVREKKLGKKSLEGFFKYDEGGRKL